jgi:hypothetical protein
MLAHKEFVAAALLAALPQKGRHLATGLLDGEPSDSSRDEIVRGEDVVG